MLETIRNKKVRVYKNLDNDDTLVPIALDELFVRSTINDDEVILHLHTLKNSAILGSPDTRVPFFNDAISIFSQNNLKTAVRNIGGLGIIADEGILNMSIIIPIECENFSINAGYELMQNFVKEIFKEGHDKIKAYEITTSYCPGDYDLSINGKKFAGIAQRKIKNVVVISIYISLYGNQKRRARLMHDFYDIGIKDQQLSYKYPRVDENSMATIEELLHKKFSLEEVFDRITKLLYNLNCTIEAGSYTTTMLADYNAIYEKLKERNNKYFNK